MQLSFPFQNIANCDSFKEENFLILSENSAAFNFFKKFFSQKEFAKAQFSSAILRGEKASGKTHLLNVFAKKFNAEFLNKDQLCGVNPTNFFAANSFYILEDFTEIEDVELLLRLINSASEASAFLVLSTNNIPKYQLKDLDSRLKNMISHEIKNPSHDSIKMLLTHNFSRLQLRPLRAVIDFLSDNIDRSFLAVSNATKLVDFYCAENGEKIDLAAVKKIFVSKK